MVVLAPRLAFNQRKVLKMHVRISDDKREYQSYKEFTHVQTALRGVAFDHLRTALIGASVLVLR